MFPQAKTGNEQRLDYAGKQLEDQFYFWMNVELALTPTVDYPLIAKLLPWCMEQAGYPQYVDAVQKAIDEGKLSATEAPSTPPNGSGYVKFEVPESAQANISNATFNIYKANDYENPITAWADANAKDVKVTVPAGEYTIQAVWLDGDKPIGFELLTENGWVTYEDKLPDGEKTFTVTAGQTTELESTGFTAF